MYLSTKILGESPGCMLPTETGNFFVPVFVLVCFGLYRLLILPHKQCVSTDGARFVPHASH